MRAPAEAWPARLEALEAERDRAGPGRLARIAAELHELWDAADAAGRRRLEDLQGRLVAEESARHAAARAEVRSGALRAERLAERVQARDEPERDAFVEQLLGITHAPFGAGRLPPDLIGHHASGWGAITKCLRGLALGPDDVFVDVGAGLGKVVLLAHLLTGVRAVGLELQPSLVAHARARAQDLGAEVTFAEGDARAALPAGTVYYLYLPCTGAALQAVLARLEAHAASRPLRVRTLGLDLGRVPWLVPDGPDDLWLSGYSTRARE